MTAVGNTVVIDDVTHLAVQADPCLLAAQPPLHTSHPSPAAATEPVSLLQSLLTNLVLTYLLLPLQLRLLRSLRLLPPLPPLLLLLLPAHLLVCQQVACDVAARHRQAQDDVALVGLAHVPVVQQLGGQLVHGLVLVDLQVCVRWWC